MRSLGLLLGGALIGVIVGVLIAGRWSRESSEPTALRAPPTRASERVESHPSPASPQPPLQPATSRLTTLGQILTLEGDFEQTAALYQLIRGADVARLESLLAEAAELDQDSEARAATSILYSRYADLDPAAALAHVQADGTPFVNSALRSIFHAWSRSDFDAALEAARSLERNDERNMASQALLSARDDLPWEERQRLAQELGQRGAFLRMESQRVLTRGIANPEAEWQAAVEIADQRKRLERLAVLAAGWALQDPAAALERVNALTDPDARRQLLMMVGAAMVNDDPRRAIDLLRSQPASPQRGMVLNTVLSRLAQSKPELAAELTLTLASPERDMAIAGVVRAWTRTDPAGAVRWFDLHADRDVRVRTLSTIATAYARHDPEAAYQWLVRMNQDDQTRAASQVLGPMARTDPEHAAELTEALRNRAATLATAPQIVRAWAEKDPVAALEWSRQLDDPQARQNLIQMTFAQWGQDDADAALDHLRTMDRSQGHDAAAVAMISVLLRKDDSSAAERLYATIEDPVQQSLAAYVLYQTYSETDPDRAERYRAITNANR